MMSVLIWVKPAPEKTLPFCLANSSWAFPWHPPPPVLRRETCKFISLEKTLPQTLHFQRQAQLLKVTTTKSKGTEKSSLSLNLEQNSCIHLFIAHGTADLQQVILAIEKRKILLTLLDRILSLLSHGKRNEDVTQVILGKHGLGLFNIQYGYYTYSL